MPSILINAAGSTRLHRISNKSSTYLSLLRRTRRLKLQSGLAKRLISSEVQRKYTKNNESCYLLYCLYEGYISPNDVQSADKIKCLGGDKTVCRMKVVNVEINGPI